MLDSTEANYVISLVTNRKQNVLLLDTCINNNNHVRYKILDVVAIGSIPASQSIVVSGCRIKKKRDSNIIAVVKPEDKEYYTKVVRAWKVNRSTRKIELMSIKDIDCVNEAYGL